MSILLEKGLGKDNQGMKTALKPVLKFDQRGVNLDLFLYIIFEFLKNKSGRL